MFVSYCHCEEKLHLESMIRFRTLKKMAFYPIIRYSKLSFMCPNTLLRYRGWTLTKYKAHLKFKWEIAVKHCF